MFLDHWPSFVSFKKGLHLTRSSICLRAAALGPRASRPSVGVGPGALAVRLTFFISHTIRSSSRACSLRAWASARAASASPCSPCPSQGTGHRCAGGLLQGSGVPSQFPGSPLQGLAAIAGGGAVHGKWFYGILLKTFHNVIELDLSHQIPVSDHPG
jgi:hypothetical protein